MLNSEEIKECGGTRYNTQTELILAQSLSARDDDTPSARVLKSPANRDSLKTLRVMQNKAISHPGKISVMHGLE